MPSAEGLRRHLVEAHSAEILQRARVDQPVSLDFLRKGFIDRLAMRDLAALHGALHPKRRSGYREVVEGPSV